MTGNLIPLISKLDDWLEKYRKKYPEQPNQSIKFVQLEPEKPEVPKVPKPCAYTFNVPVKYRECSFDNFIGHEKIVSGLKEYCKTEDSIYIYGKTGCGKTHLAVACIMGGLIESGEFITVPELLLKIRSSFSDKSAWTEEEIINQYSNTGLLVLDDLGAEKTTEYSITTLYLIIDRRNRNNRKTIITSNLSPEEIEEKLDARIASRIADMKVVNLSKLPDYRKRR